MKTRLEINTRELLREFKDIKEKLLNHEIQQVVIPMKDNKFLKIELEEEEDNRQAILDILDSIKKPIKVKRNKKLMNTLIRL
jgi:uncharacterized protein YqgV (UPF0045/DUF77 family)